MEQGGALSGRIPLGKPFEGVKQNVMRERHFIRREVALEHTPVRTKLLDAICHEWRHGGGQLFRTDGLGALVPVKTQAGHTDTTQLQVDVWTLRHGRDTAPPDG